jgi:cytochrome d ubiquinol oxidase subunit I
VASVYAVGMLRGRNDHYHRLGFAIGFSVASIAMPFQMGVGDSLARWVYNEQPTKFAAIELVTETGSDKPEILLGRINEDGEIEGGIPLPGVASILSDPSTGTATVIQGLDAVPEEDRPSFQQVNIVHLAWDVMVGIGTLLFLIALYYGGYWLFRRRLPQGRWFLRIAACCGVLSVLALEAGWVVAEVGRQPWIVYNYMKVEEAATANTYVWVTFIGVTLLYIGLGYAAIRVLRTMSRRAREGVGVDDDDGPYGPSGPIAGPIEDPVPGELA